MSDSSYPIFQHYGTNAERVAFTPVPAGGQPIYIWRETDTGSVYIYDTSWHLVVAGGTTPAMVQLAQITTAAAQATIDFTSISGAYKNLKIIGESQDTIAGVSSSVIRAKINNDGTSGNYTGTQLAGAQNGLAVASGVAASAGGVFVSGSPNTGNTGIVAGVEILIPDYSGTTFHKRIMSQCAYDDGTTNVTSLTTSSRWKSAAAITRVTITTDGTAFANGLIWTLYGLT